MDSLQERERAKQLMEEANLAFKDHNKKYAEYEQKYRMTLAKTIIKLVDTDGYSQTAASTLAEGDEKVAEYKKMRNLEDGLRESAKNAIVNFRKEMEMYHEDYKIDMHYGKDL